MHLVNVKVPERIKSIGMGLAVAAILGACATPDRDLDGIPDKVDECPAATEDFDGFDDTDGCPDLDNDKDGVPDGKDKCPLDAEDRDGFEDVDGCPDSDNDKDGIPDLKDKCPDHAEDRDGFEDADGCPDLDNDKDGIPDLKDKCPDQAETLNGKDDEDGCPDMEADPLADEFTLPIRFETGSAALTFEDKTMLDQSVMPGLKAFPAHKIYVYLFMPLLDYEEEAYLELLNARSQSLGAYLEAQGAKREQIKIRTVTPELLEANKGTDEDFQSSRPVTFRVKK